MINAVHCPYFESRQCRSCQWLDRPYTQQLAQKEAELAHFLQPFSAPPFLPSLASAQSGFRNKAKMVALGTTTQTLLGILGPKAQPISLCACPLYPTDMQEVLQAVENWLSTLAIPPYDVKGRRGELKYCLLNRNEQGIFMLRFVLRSSAAISAIRDALPNFLASQPQIQTVSVNIQPLHAAIIEGPEEQILLGNPWLCQTLNDIPLYQRPKGFFQTNSTMAESLYATAAQWLKDLPIKEIWDLFCGSGGFGLHCLTPARTLVGIEIEEEAIACAKRSAEELGVQSQVSFRALDSGNFTDNKANTDGAIAVPDVIIANPPRRGLGQQLCNDLCTINPPYILYSSCNAQTLAKDLEHLPQYSLQKVQLFDMFPNTAHYEVLVLLARI